jgi:hypothetical protein
MHEGCKVYMDSYMALNISRFMVAWTNFKNNLLEVSLAQNRETMPWRSEHSQPLVCFILSCVRTHMNRNSLK